MDKRGLVSSLAAVVVGWASGGCHMAVNPFEDELASLPPITTPSVEGVREQGRSATSRPARAFGRTQASAAPGPVTHFPLYFSDRHESGDAGQGGSGGCKDDGSAGDARFAWDGRDYVLILYGEAQFLISAIGFPISAVAAPPWSSVSSDEEPGLTNGGGIALPRLKGG